MARQPGAVGTVFVISAGVLWGTLGLFVHYFADLGFSSLQIAAMRFMVAALVFSLVITVRGRGEWHIRLRDVPLFLGLGLVSLTFFTFCYFSSIQMMSMSAAAILLYTSPIWVMLMSAVLFHEKLTKKKLVALACAFAGCVLVSGFDGTVTLTGLLLGLCSAIGYGLYSIFGTMALKRYSPFTVTTYAFIIAGLATLLLSSPTEIVATAANISSPGWFAFTVVVMGCLTAIVPFLLYTLGLQKMEASKAAIFATVEPVVASLLGVLVRGETMTVLACAGCILVLGAVILLSLPSRARGKAASTRTAS